MQIKGARVVLRLIEEKDIPNIQALWNNGEVMKWVNFPNGLNISLEEVKSWYEKVSQSKRVKEFVVLLDDAFCGEVFYGKDVEHRRAGLDIKFLPEYQGMGLASEALQLLIDHVFTTESEIDAVWTEPSAVNPAAQKLYAKCGLSAKERPADMEPEDSYWELSRADWDKLR